MNDQRISEELDVALRRADDLAAADGCRVSTVGHVVAAILDDGSALPPDVRTALAGYADADALRAEAAGASVGRVTDQKERVMEAAQAFAASRGEISIRAVHYVVAAHLTVGDQLAGLEPAGAAGLRLLGDSGGEGTWARRALVHRGWTVQRARSTVRDADSRYRTFRWGRRATSGYRSVMANFRSGTSAALFLPGLLVRESLWVALAWAIRSSRAPRSILGVDGATGLTTVPPTRARLRVEVAVSALCLVLGMVALAAWMVPRAELGTLRAASFTGTGDFEFVGWSASSGGGILDLGPWVPWTLLAVAMPGWRHFRRMVWTAHLMAGRVTRTYLWLLYPIAAASRPVEAVLSPLGVPEIVAKGAVIIGITTLAFRLLV